MTDDELWTSDDCAVFVYDIVADNTVDDLVLARHATKREVQDLLLESMRRRTR